MLPSVPIFQVYDFFRQHIWYLISTISTIRQDRQRQKQQKYFGDELNGYQREKKTQCIGSFSIWLEVGVWGAPTKCTWSRPILRCICRQKALSIVFDIIRSFTIQMIWQSANFNELSQIVKGRIFLGGDGGDRKVDDKAGKLPSTSQRSNFTPFYLRLESRQDKSHPDTNITYIKWHLLKRLKFSSGYEIVTGNSLLHINPVVGFGRLSGEYTAALKEL